MSPDNPAQCEGSKMKRWIISDTMACMVTWQYYVEAESQDEAQEKFCNGEHDPAEGPPEIGDSLDYVPQHTEIAAIDD
jgi:hypothetical protein